MVCVNVLAHRTRAGGRLYGAQGEGRGWPVTEIAPSHEQFHSAADSWGGRPTANGGPVAWADTWFHGAFLRPERGSVSSPFALMTDVTSYLQSRKRLLITYTKGHFTKRRAGTISKTTVSGVCFPKTSL